MLNLEIKLVNHDFQSAEAEIAHEDFGKNNQKVCTFGIGHA